MNNENERNFTAPNYEGPTEAIAKRLENLLDQKIANPHSLLAMLEFKRFIDGLPYGKVTFETLTALSKKVMEADPRAAAVLLDYATNQELHLQNHPKMDK